MAGRPAKRFEEAGAFREVLYAALGEPIGLTLDSGGNAASVRARLYQERKKLADPALEALQIRQCPSGLAEPKGDLVIVKVQRSNGNAKPEPAGDS